MKSCGCHPWGQSHSPQRLSSNPCVGEKCFQAYALYCPVLLNEFRIGCEPCAIPFASHE